MAEEAQPLSAEEKIANMMFGEEVKKAPVEEVEEDYQPDPKPVPEGEDSEEVEATEEGDEETPQEENFVEIEVDGELLQVPEKYKDHFLRQDDYTRKTQEVAAERKTLEVIRGEVEIKQRDQQFFDSVYEDVLRANQKHAEAEQWQQYLRQNVDNLSSTEIEKIRIAVQDAQSEAQQIANEVQRKQQEHQQAQQQSQQELLKKGTEVLKSTIPNWGEEAQKQVMEHVLAKGFTPSEVNSLMDPRMVEIAWEAAQYRALKRGSAQAVKRVQSAPQIRPKSRNPMPDAVKDKLNLRKKLKSKNVSDHEKANLVGESLAKKFGM